VLGFVTPVEGFICFSVLGDLDSLRKRTSSLHMWIQSHTWTWFQVL